MPFLIVRSGPRAGERIELVDELVVGRENADLTVNDEEVSRRHLAVRPHEDGVELEDLGSTNGTFVDGARLSAVVVVSSTARVILGETELEIEVEEPEPEFDPGATRLRERPPERDATIVAPVPATPPPDATIAGAPVPPAPPPPRVAPAEPPRAAPAPVAAAPAPAAAAPAAPAPAAPAPAAAGAAGARPFGSFTPAAPARRRGGAATRQWGAAGIVFLVIIATAIALIVYFAAR
jgi:predicted component of type VI protein secretion system